MQLQMTILFLAQYWLTDPSIPYQMYHMLTIKQMGFTLVELIFIILIVGIISVMIMPSWTGTTLDLSYEAQQVLNDIQYAQALSINTGQRYRWVLVSSTSYSVTDSAGTAILLPSGSTLATLSNGVSIGSLSNLPNSLIAFDSLGAPYTDTGSPGTALASTASIPISATGGSYTIQITPGTGYGVLS